MCFSPTFVERISGLEEDSGVFVIIAILVFCFVLFNSSVINIECKKILFFIIFPQ